ncbi:MAG: GDSL family lipase [Acidobacteriia bacterium]|nr:GDSL family lipase [Terriglobia bacterium]
MLLGLGLLTACGPSAGPRAQNEARFERLLRDASHGRAKVIFFGDSLSDQWRHPGFGQTVWRSELEPLDAANLGISGDRTSDLLDRIEQGRIEDLDPEGVVVLIGTNDVTAGSPPEAIVDAIERIVAALRSRLPRARILVLGLLPRDARASPRRAAVTEVNRLLARLDDGAHVRFLDIGDRFVLPDGTIPREVMPDGLHLSPAGYRIWAEAMRPALTEMLARPAAGPPR